VFCGEGIHLRLRVLVVDDHRLILRAIRDALDEGDEFEIVAETRFGVEVLPLVGHHRPDVVLLDAEMPDISGLIVLERLRQRFPDTDVVMLSDSGGAVIELARERGARALILKQIDPEIFLDAVREALSSPEEQPVLSVELTARELGILSLVAAGKANREIAHELFITEQTVKFHLTNIYRKLDIQNRTEAARFAFEHGLAKNPYLISPTSSQNGG
jgi:DNA-binding NarL/FixJ family response regulator